MKAEGVIEIATTVIIFLLILVLFGLIGVPYAIYTYIKYKEWPWYREGWTEEDYEEDWDEWYSRIVEKLKEVVEG